MKKIFFIITITIAFSSCVKNIGNGAPPYMRISLDNSFTDDMYINDSLTDSVAFNFTVYLKSFNDAEIGNFIIYSDTDDTLFYNEYSNQLSVTKQIEYLPEFGLTEDTTLVLTCYAKPNNSDIVDKYRIYFKIYPSSN